MKISLPRRQWFIQNQADKFITNTYSGSIGTLANKGCMVTHTFDYRVFPDISREEKTASHLVAEGFIIEPWAVGGKRVELAREAFELSEKGIIEAGEWLGKLAAKHGF